MDPQPGSLTKYSHSLLENSLVLFLLKAISISTKHTEPTVTGYAKTHTGAAKVTVQSGV